MFFSDIILFTVLVDCPSYETVDGVQYCKKKEQKQQFGTLQNVHSTINTYLLISVMLSNTDVLEIMVNILISFLFIFKVYLCIKINM